MGVLVFDPLLRALAGPLRCCVSPKELLRGLSPPAGDRFPVPAGAVTKGPAALRYPEVIGLLRGRPGWGGTVDTGAARPLASPLCGQGLLCVPDLPACGLGGSLQVGVRGQPVSSIRSLVGSPVAVVFLPGRALSRHLPVQVHRCLSQTGQGHIVWCWAASHPGFRGPLRGHVCCPSGLEQRDPGAGAARGGDCACWSRMHRAQFAGPSWTLLVVTLLFYLCFQMSLSLHFVGDAEI